MSSSHLSGPAAASTFARERDASKLILTNGQSYRSITLTPLLIACVSVLLIGLVTWCVGLSGYIFFRDDVVRSMMRKHGQTVEDYEDRIAVLRLRVDSIRARQFINQDSFGDLITGLQDRQEEIKDSQAEIMAIVDRARQAGVRLESDALDRADPITTGSISPAVTDLAPHSVTLAASPTAGDRPLSRPAVGPRETLGFADAPDTTMTRVARLIDEELRTYAYGQSAVLNALEQKTATRAQALQAVFDRIKLDRKRFGLNAKSAMGGPFIPADTAENLTPANLQIARVEQNLALADSLAATIGALPIKRPVGAAHTISSRFGSRMDPFFRRRAFHSGIDFRAPTGTKIRATASGRVRKAGWAGGYGRMIEIDHGNGLMTRYAHLSRISVKRGQRISQGAVIGRVGSTGRSTGPHLHYETHIDGRAVNPIRFLTAL